MTTTEILTIAQALTADTRVMSWGGRGGRVIEIHFVAAGGGMFQLRDTQGPALVEVLGFAATESALNEARAIARLRAQLNEM